MANQHNRTLAIPLVLNSGADFAVAIAAYTANDVVGGLSKFVYATGAGGMLASLKIVDDAVQSEPYIIHLYKTAPSTVADAAAMAETFADGKLEIGRVVVGAGNYVTANGSAYSIAHMPEVNLKIPEVCAGTVYVYLECTATPDYAAITDLYVEALFWID